MIHDTHMHLDLYPIKHRNSIINSIEDEKLYVIAMTNLPTLFEKYETTYNSLSHIRFALGYHPELIKLYPQHLDAFIKNISKTKYIGEIGLDYSSKNRTSQDIQLDYFRRIISACQNSKDKKFISIHSRNAVHDIIDIIGIYEGTVVMHWFSGTKNELSRSLDNGYYFSINSAMLDSKKGQNIIMSIPHNRILLETDAPFTKGMKDHYDISIIEQTKRTLSRILNLSEATLNEILYCNFKRAISI